MSTITESDVKDLKDLIIALRTDIKGIDNRLTNLETRFTSLETGFISLEARFTSLETRFTSLEIGQAKIDGKLEGVQTASQKIPDLAERVGELKNWKQIGLTLGGALLGGLITYLVKNSHP